MRPVPQDTIDRLRAAIDDVVAYEVANPGTLPDFVVEIVGVSSALLRAVESAFVPPPSSRKEPSRDVSDVRSWSVASGYTGDACTRCGSFTLRRKGTCLSCDSCAHSSGCS